MFKNYLITSFRNLQRNKIYALLNVFGLAIGIGCALVIFKVIQFEYSFDQHQPNYHNVYRLIKEEVYPDKVEKEMGNPHPAGPALKNDYPELIDVVRTNYTEYAQINVTTEEGFMDKFMLKSGIVFTEPSFFRIFPVEWIAGDPQTALSAPNTVVISSSEVQKIFHLKEETVHEAIGRTINFGNIKDFTVVGVIADPPQNTNFPFTYLFDYYSQDGEINPYFQKGTFWHSNSSATNTYLLVDDHFNPEAFNEKLVDFTFKYFDEGTAKRNRYLVQPLADVHFDNEYGNYTEPISKQYIYTFGIIGIFLILTACINFINLATAQATNRAKEIGIRKTIGVQSRQLMAQFMTETAIITFISLMCSIVVSEAMLGILNEILGYDLQLDLFHSPSTALILLVLFFAVSLLSGFYPSLILSRMNAIGALKSKANIGDTHGFSLRKALVVAQFTISQFLIIGTLVISAQNDYFVSKDLGFNTEAIIASDLPERDQAKTERFRKLILENPGFTEVCFSMSEPTGSNNSHSNFNYAPLNSPDNYNASFKAIDEHYFDLFGLKLLAGRGIQKTDSNQTVISRKVADFMGFKDNYDGALGEHLLTGWMGGKTVVGVVEDFHSRSLEHEIDFIFFINFPRAFYTIDAKIARNYDKHEAFLHFNAVADKVFPEYVMDIHFYDEELQSGYDHILKITQLMQIFAVISILIGCLGLYGLISFIALNKTKEVSVRKVLGATVTDILVLFSREITWLLLIAFIITTPLAYYVLSEWLSNFSYHIGLNPVYFITGLLITLVIALLTISYKTITTALINPAKTLKDE